MIQQAKHLWYISIRLWVQISQLPCKNKAFPITNIRGWHLCHLPSFRSCCQLQTWFYILILNTLTSSLRIPYTHIKHLGHARPTPLRSALHCLPTSHTHTCWVQFMSSLYTWVRGPHWHVLLLVDILHPNQPVTAQRKEAVWHVTGTMIHIHGQYPTPTSHLAQVGEGTRQTPDLSQDFYIHSKPYCL